MEESTKEKGDKKTARLSSPGKRRDIVRHQNRAVGRSSIIQTLEGKDETLRLDLAGRGEPVEGFEWASDVV